MKAAAAASKAAKVGVALLVSPVAGAREAGVALIDILVKADSEMKKTLDGVTAELTRLAQVRGYSYEQARTAFQAMQDLLEFHKLTTDELTAIGFDPNIATTRQLAAGAPVMRGLSQDRPT